MPNKTKQYLVQTDGTTLVDPINVPEIIKNNEAKIEAQNLVMARQDGLFEADRTTIDFGWLKQASYSYKISANIKDYLMVPVIGFYANVPNRNGHGFLLSDLTTFLPDTGRISYKTWIGKPVLHEHEGHTEPSTAKGVVLDTFLKKDRNHWKMIAYLAIDRTKSVEIAERIMDRELTTYSVGAHVTSFDCSICSRNMGSCTHLDTRKPRWGSDIVQDGPNLQVAFAMARYPLGFEISIVEQPAFSMADNDKIQLPFQQEKIIEVDLEHG